MESQNNRLARNQKEKNLIFTESRASLQKPSTFAIFFQQALQPIFHRNLRHRRQPIHK